MNLNDFIQYPSEFIGTPDCSHLRVGEVDDIYKRAIDLGVNIWDCESCYQSLLDEGDLEQYITTMNVMIDNVFGLDLDVPNDTSVVDMDLDEGWMFRSEITLTL